MKNSLLLSAALMTLAAPAFAETGVTAPVNIGTNAAGETIPTDMTIARNEGEFRSNLMAVGGLSLDESRIAVTKATDPRVVAFAKAEVVEQEGIAAKLKARNTLEQPQSKDAAMSIDALNKASKGKSFDEAYIAGQVKGHEKLQALGDNYMHNAPASGSPKEEGEVRKMATEAMPLVRQHLTTAKDLLGKL